MKEQHQSGLIFKCAIVRVILIGCVVLFSCGDEDDIPSNGVELEGTVGRRKGSRD